MIFTGITCLVEERTTITEEQGDMGRTIFELRQNEDTLSCELDRLKSDYAFEREELVQEKIVSKLFIGSFRKYAFENTEK